MARGRHACLVSATRQLDVQGGQALGVGHQAGGDCQLCAAIKHCQCQSATPPAMLVAATAVAPARAAGARVLAQAIAQAAAAAEQACDSWTWRQRRSTRQGARGTANCSCSTP